MTSLHFQHGHDVVERIATSDDPTNATESVVRIVEVTRGGKAVKTASGNEYDRLTGGRFDTRLSYRSIRLVAGTAPKMRALSP